MQMCQFHFLGDPNLPASFVVEVRVVAAKAAVFWSPWLSASPQIEHFL